MRLRHLRASKGSKAGIRRAADGGPAIASDVPAKDGTFWRVHAGDISWLPSGYVKIAIENGH